MSYGRFELLCVLAIVVGVFVIDSTPIGPGILRWLESAPQAQAQLGPGGSNGTIITDPSTPFDQLRGLQANVATLRFDADGNVLARCVQ